MNDFFYPTDYRWETSDTRTSADPRIQSLKLVGGAAPHEKKYGEIGGYRSPPPLDKKRYCYIKNSDHLDNNQFFEENSLHKIA